MLRRFLFLVAGNLALVVVLGGPGQVHAQHSRGGPPHGMNSGPRRGFTPGFRNGSFDPRFNRGRFDRFEDRFENRRFDRFEDRFESRFPFGRFDRFEDRFERRSTFGVLPHFVGGFVPGFPIGFVPGF